MVLMMVVVCVGGGEGVNGEAHILLCKHDIHIIMLSAAGEMRKYFLILIIIPNP